MKAPPSPIQIAFSPRLACNWLRDVARTIARAARHPRARVWDYQTDGDPMEERLRYLLVGWVEARGHPQDASYSIIAGAMERGWMRQAEPICDIVYINGSTSKPVDDAAHRIFLQATLPPGQTLWVRSLREQTRDIIPNKMKMFRACSADMSGHERLKAIAAFRHAEDQLVFTPKGHTP